MPVPAVSRACNTRRRARRVRLTTLGKTAALRTEATKNINITFTSGYCRGAYKKSSSLQSLLAVGEAAEETEAGVAGADGLTGVAGVVGFAGVDDDEPLG